MIADPSGSALDVACRKCGARPRKRCKNTAGPGWFTGVVHIERWADAAQLPTGLAPVIPIRALPGRQEP